MARKKKKKNDEAGFQNPDESIGSMRTEGFGDTAAYEDTFAPVVGEPIGEPPAPVAPDLGTSELDELDDVLVLLPEEDEPVSQDSVALFATESLGDSMGFDDTSPLGSPDVGSPGMGSPGMDSAAPTDAFGSGPAPAAGPFGADELGSDPQTDAYPGFNDPLPPPSIDPSGTAAVPGTEAPTGVEDVGLLSQHPSHGELPVAEFDSDSSALGLPDIEDVEDITSLVEEAVAYDMPPPQNDFEDEAATGEAPTFEVVEGSGSSGFGIFLKLVAAAAIIVLGVEFGPGLYDKYLEQTSGGSGAVADRGETSPEPAVNTPSEPSKEPVTDRTSGGEIAGTTPSETNPSNPTETTSVETVSAAGNAARVELGNWLTEVVASNFGVSSTPSAR